MEKTAKFLEERRIPLNDARQLPNGELYAIFNGASTAEDKHLSEMWAHLLASSMDPDFSDERTNIYSDVLRGLAPIDARVLEIIVQAERISKAVREFKAATEKELYQASFEIQKKIDAALDDGEEKSRLASEKDSIDQENKRLREDRKDFATREFGRLREVWEALEKDVGEKLRQIRLNLTRLDLIQSRFSGGPPGFRDRAESWKFSPAYRDLVDRLDYSYGSIDASDFLKLEGDEVNKIAIQLAVDLHKWVGSIREYLNSRQGDPELSISFAQTSFNCSYQITAFGEDFAAACMHHASKS
ncbi:Abi-alpha family protein [Roseitranquillus sediminis]|uniref:Abi-alpha family protein n=1 Tax=Roseitranquillus sediminis TaxID=2809051 RepID=UPI001D0CBFD5|nr:Abi-alpha family protein [Roseitranquillus sediminis]MBM9596382.1 DUF4393 domain-containing protein [Roseitranquillus sediminis]